MNLRELIKLIQQDTGLEGQSLIDAVMDYIKKNEFHTVEELGAFEEEVRERVLGKR
jgi:hypothetical protein